MKKVLWTKQELAEALGQEIQQHLDDIIGISIDTRSIKTGDLFFALKGDNFNGNCFIEEAITKGASLCIVDDISKVEKKNKEKVIVVNNVPNTLNELAKYRRNSLKGKIICVTGSLGKTITKEMLKLALSSYGKTYASSKNLNNHYGVPLSLVRTPIDVDFCILELGMSGPTEIDKLSKIAQPNIGIITNIQPVHLQFFHSVTEIAYAKAEIFKNITAFGSCIINNDDYNYIMDQKAYKYGIKTLQFGIGTSSDCYIKNIKSLSNGLKLVDIYCLGRYIKQEFHQDISEHLIYNSLAVFICLSTLNLNLAPAQKALKEFKADAGRGQVVRLSKNITLLDESYNSSPVSVEATIRNLVARKTKESRAIAILGDMKELGAEEEKFHKNINTEGVDKLFCVGKLMKLLYNKVDDHIKGALTTNSQEMSEIISDNIQNNDIILVKGSFSMNMKLIVDKIKREFLKK